MAEEPVLAGDVESGSVKVEGYHAKEDEDIDGVRELRRSRISGDHGHSVAGRPRFYQSGRPGSAARRRYQ